MSDDAAHFGGQHVDQPWEAYAQANVIAEHANEIAGGKTYYGLSPGWCRPYGNPARSSRMHRSVAGRSGDNQSRSPGPGRSTVGSRVSR